ncbi:hypothetical protein B0O80DRAFT_492698 [Mortierella sp. GBAus27b]|nr:hypothetical protein B0O80DRAFT_492698 [Mortierella sp. GBAus27b]
MAFSRPVLSAGRPHLNLTLIKLPPLWPWSAKSILSPHRNLNITAQRAPDTIPTKYETFAKHIDNDDSKELVSIMKEMQGIFEVESAQFRARIAEANRKRKDKKREREMRKQQEQKQQEQEQEQEKQEQELDLQKQHNRKRDRDAPGLGAGEVDNLIGPGTKSSHLYLKETFTVHSTNVYEATYLDVFILPIIQASFGKLDLSYRRDEYLDVSPEYASEEFRPDIQFLSKKDGIPLVLLEAKKPLVSEHLLLRDERKFHRDQEIFKV